MFDADFILFTLEWLNSRRSRDRREREGRSAAARGWARATGAQNEPVLTSPARLNVAIITPAGDDLDSTNV